MGEDTIPGGVHAHMGVGGRFNFDSVSTFQDVIKAALERNAQEGARALGEGGGATSASADCTKELDADVEDMLRKSICTEDTAGSTSGTTASTMCVRKWLAGDELDALGEEGGGGEACAGDGSEGSEGAGEPAPRTSATNDLIRGLKLMMDAHQSGGILGPEWYNQSDEDCYRDILNKLCLDMKKGLKFDLRGPRRSGPSTAKQFALLWGAYDLGGQGAHTEARLAMGFRPTDSFRVQPRETSFLVGRWALIGERMQHWVTQAVETTAALGNAYSVRFCELAERYTPQDAVESFIEATKWCESIRNLAGGVTSCPVSMESLRTYYDTMTTKPLDAIRMLVGWESRKTASFQAPKLFFYLQETFDGLLVNVAKLEESILALTATMYTQEGTLFRSEGVTDGLEIDRALAWLDFMVAGYLPWCTRPLVEMAFPVAPVPWVLLAARLFDVATALFSYIQETRSRDFVAERMIFLDNAARITEYMLKQWEIEMKAGPQENIVPIQTLEVLGLLLAWKRLSNKHGDLLDDPSYDLGPNPKDWAEKVETTADTVVKLLAEQQPQRFDYLLFVSAKLGIFFL